MKARVVMIVSAVIIAVGVAVSACVGCSGGTVSGGSATARLKHHFGLEDVSSPDSIQSGLESKVRIGTPEGEIYAFLKQGGIGNDKLSSYHPADKTGEIVCRIELDPSSLGIVKESYGISFYLDGSKRLMAIQVRKWQTGL